MKKRKYEFKIKTKIYDYVKLSNNTLLKKNEY